MVSVLMITYNHENFIRESIEGVLMQKTDFKVELIIGEDCSTDNTRSIVVDYADKYPEIVKPQLPKINRGMQNNFLSIVNAAKGKYIAICEGDDYWTDPYKLQKQVDFLEANLEYTICFHPVICLNEAKPEQNHIFPQLNDQFTIDKMTVDYLVERNFIQTNSVLLRKMTPSIYEAFPNDILPGDWYLFLLHAKYGKIAYINEPMSVYRIHEGGIWYGDPIYNHAIKRRAFIDKVNLLFESKYNKILEQKVKQFYSHIFNSCVARNDFSKLKELVSIYHQDVFVVLDVFEKTIFDYKNQLNKFKGSKEYKIGRLIFYPFRIAKRLLNLIDRKTI